MDLYIPRGYVTTPDAVDRVFTARHPDLAASASARDAEQRRLAVRNVELSINTSYIPKVAAPRIVLEKFEAEVLERIHVLERIGELQQIEAEVRSLKNALAIELRRALAEGDLVGTPGHDETSPFSKSRWREDDGLAVVRKGALSDRVAGTPARPMEYSVVIREMDLSNWLHSQTTGEQGAKSAANQGGAPKTAGQAAPPKKPPFDPLAARGLLAVQKLIKKWPSPPAATVTREFLLLHFNGVSNGPHLEVRAEVWPGQIRRGRPTTKRRTNNKP